MKNFVLFNLLLLLFSSAQIFSQNDWQYTQRLYFPESDTAVIRPYLSTLTEDGKLFVISSRITDVNAHNSIYVLNPGDTVFQKFIDYNENGDSDTLVGNIGALRGITSLGNTLYVTATQPYPKTQPNTVSATYIYPNFDTSQVQKFGFNIQGSGYGSYNHGCDITKDSILFTGISFGTSFRGYNFSFGWTDIGYGSYIPPPQYVVEPGGLERGGLDLIRDVALLPGGDYNNDTVSFFTSRNTHPDPPQSGGIAKWVGGTQYIPLNYQPARVEDLDAFLVLGTAYPCGIDLDKDGLLWVAGIDSNRRWVKAFFVDGILALPVYDLPSQFSADIQDPNGAPMGSPCDVSINSDANTAYVIDHWGRSAFKFQKGSVNVDDDKLAGVFDFSLEQNYPNPFNPSTLIRFNLPSSGNVKLVVTDLLGKEVATLVDDNLTAGRHTKSFTADNLSSGIYFYTLITDNAKVSKKMLLMK
jgi:hypothetical protein